MKDSRRSQRANEGFSFLATFERASTREEILSSLHQAVVEVITLRDSIFPLHRDLGHVTYPPAVLASISSTTIDYDSTGRQIVLRYNSGGEQLILEAISDLKKQTLGSPVSTVSTVSTPANADAEVETSETRGDPSSASDQGFQDGQMQEAAPSAHDMEEGQTHISMGSKEESNTESGERHRDNVEDLPPQKRTSYAVPSADFVTMPLEPLELRFAVSSLDPISLTVLIQCPPDHQAVVPADGISHTRSSHNPSKDFKAHLQLS